MREKASPYRDQQVDYNTIEQSDLYKLVLRRKINQDSRFATTGRNFHTNVVNSVEKIDVSQEPENAADEYSSPLGHKIDISKLILRRRANHFSTARNSNNFEQRVKDPSEAATSKMDRDSSDIA